jgi:type I restriction enzyme S subunit
MAQVQRVRSGTILRNSTIDDGRLDASHYLPQNAAAVDLLKAAEATGVEFIRLERIADSIWAPSRFKRTYAVEGETSVPYLRAYDIFEYLPDAADHLSEKRTDDLDTYRVRNGLILQTCSGRNLGPAVVVDSYLDGFVMSHDLLRVDIRDELTRMYVLTYLKSSLGQAMVRRDKTGSVIDHISDSHLSRVAVPMLAPVDRSRIGQMMLQAKSLREQARLDLSRERHDYEASLPPFDAGPRRHGWNVLSSLFTGRLDAASYGPLARGARDALLANGGLAIGEVARVEKPAGRYTTRYVKPSYGLPFVGVTNALHATPINLQYIAPSALRSLEDYRLDTDWTIFQADGRSEEALGVPVMVTPDRAGWLASGHVGRIIPSEGIDPGWVYLAWQNNMTQLQVKSLACGSVVDALYPDELRRVVIPRQRDGGIIRRAWHLMATAQERETRAITEFEQAIAKAAV